MATIYDDTEEDIYWQNADPDELWIYDKLILSRKFFSDSLKVVFVPVTVTVNLR